MITLPDIFDDSRLPVRLGNPLRVPHYTWNNWGIYWDNDEDFQELVELSEKTYRNEWRSATTKRHNEINKAAEQAGLERANDLLNKEVANIVANILETVSGTIRILDIGAGAGATSKAIIDTISKEKAKEIELILLEPAQTSLDASKAALSSHELGEVIKYQFIEAPDLEILNYIENDSIDIAVSVAAIHHHAYLDNPFQLIYEAIRTNGYFITGDWHNSMWTTPAHTHLMLSKMEWKSKQTDLRNFKMIYSLSQNKIPLDLNPDEDEANRQISQFWNFYSKLTRGQDQKFLALEGHRPASQYTELMQNVGYYIDGTSIKNIIPKNPLFLLPGSSLLAVTMGRKE